MNHEDYRRLKRREELAAKLIAFAIVVALALVVVALCLWPAWYRAGVQQRVYQREGVDITRWEVFCGAKPAEREVRVR